MTTQSQSEQHSKTEAALIHTPEKQNNSEVHAVDYWNDLDLKKFIAIGGSVFFAEYALIYPFEVVKTRMQADNAAHSSIFRHTVDQTKAIYKEAGVRGFYKGYGIFTVGSFPSHVCYLLAYQFTKSKLQQAYEQVFNKGEKMEATALWIPAVAGAVADIANTFFYVPFDVVSQRLQMGDKRYTSGTQAFAKIFKDEGVKGLFKGSMITLMTLMPFSASWWLIYERSKHLLTKNDPRTYFMPSRQKTKEEIQAELNNANNYFAQITAGLLAGSISTIAINPLDVVKTRMQVNHFEGSANMKMIRSELVGMVKNEGYRSLMKGVLPKIFINSVFSGLGSITYEFVMKLSRTTTTV